MAEASLAQRCTCLATDPQECYQLRHYGMYPSLAAQEADDEEDCVCICHEGGDWQYE